MNPLASRAHPTVGVQRGKIGGGRAEVGSRSWPRRIVNATAAVLIPLVVCACAPYEYSGNRPVRLGLTVNSPVGLSAHR